MTILYMDEYHHHLTIHFADGTIQESEKKGIAYLDELCRAYGSTYEGRRQAACSILSIRQKAPIYVNDSLIMFPNAMNVEHKFWINYLQIKDMKEVSYQTMFTFLNDSEVLVDMGYRSAIRQKQRCYKYLYTIQWNRSHSLDNLIL